jgi:coenzyme F420-0:L-glutamate ligase/coenzyme F420-1:gamma-L-glutamate ligase
VSPDTTRRLRQSERDYLEVRRVGRLATADAKGRPHAVPVCYVLAGDALFIALDEKPKSVAPRRLRRVRNLQANPTVMLLVDDYSDNWQLLSFVQVQGIAQLVEPGGACHAAAVQQLRSKFPQYVSMAIDQQPLIRIDPTDVASWSWSGDRFPSD